MNLKKWIIAIVLAFPACVFAQGFLHADGTRIVDGSGENFIIRSIGTGNWMIMEGYMMQSHDAGIGTHTEFRDKLEESIGKERTDSFYTVWLDNHFTKRDMDSMKVWGFNAVRPALHYKWFTPAIEDEPVQGEITWIEDGFRRLDSLVSWATANEMYIIFDMHGAPGGQGKNADISDYDSDLPSLWESEYNKKKLVALWHKIAERYSTEPYVGGYDMINEINWDFANSGNENGCNCEQNQPMIDIFKRIIDTIRLVDNNHLVFVSGNCWGNKYDGLNALAELDDNLAYTFHKYWNYNPEDGVEWILDRTNSLNVPVWMSESGENSNTWFTNAIHLFEANNIGWSWWPVKKAGLNNVMEVTKNDEYGNVISHWTNGSPSMTEDEIFQAVLTWADNHKLENTFIHYDVIDAMIRQPFSYEAIPFTTHNIGDEIFFADYDLGRNNVAYFDTDTANYHVSTGTYVTWNAGWGYRNDGVDIEACTDDVNNGFNVGWTNKGEWMQYSFYNDTEAAYTFDIRSASGASGSVIHFEVNGIAVSKAIQLPATGGWQDWETTTVSGIILPKGDIKLRVVINQSGSNLNYFTIKDPVSVNDIDLEVYLAEALSTEMTIAVTLNKSATTIDLDQAKLDFTLFSDDETVSIESVSADVNNASKLYLAYDAVLMQRNSLKLSYSGNSVMSGDAALKTVDKMDVVNNLPSYAKIPGKIQAENFFVNNGLVVEECEDAGGGSNMGYADNNDYLDYLVEVTEAGDYTATLRIATTAGNAKLSLQAGTTDNLNDLGTLSVSSTGGWQNWESQTLVVSLAEGPQTLRLFVNQGPVNINWLSFSAYNSVTETNNELDFTMFPNPTNGACKITLPNTDELKTIEVFDYSGKLIMERVTVDHSYLLNTQSFNNGIYIVKISNGTQIGVQRLVISK